MGIIYSLILKVAFKQEQAIALQLTCANVKGTKVKIHGLRATKTLAIVYGAFLICWLPLSIITLTANFCPKCFIKFQVNYRIAFNIVVVVFLLILPLLNSCMNPFIYIMFNRQFRYACKGLLYKILRKPMDNYDPATGRKRTDTNETRV